MNTASGGALPKHCNCIGRGFNRSDYYTLFMAAMHATCTTLCPVIPCIALHHDLTKGPAVTSCSSATTCATAQHYNAA